MSIPHVIFPIPRYAGDLQVNNSLSALRSLRCALHILTLQGLNKHLVSSSASIATATTATVAQFSTMSVSPKRPQLPPAEKPPASPSGEDSQLVVYGHTMSLELDFSLLSHVLESLGDALCNFDPSTVITHTAGEVPQPSPAPHVLVGDLNSVDKVLLTTANSVYGNQPRGDVASPLHISAVGSLPRYAWDELRLTPALLSRTLATSAAEAIYDLVR